MKLKIIFHHAFLALLFIMGITFINSPALGEASLSITANNGTNRVLVMPGIPVHVVIELKPESYSGVNADWWLLAETQMGTFHYDIKHDGNWTPGQSVTYRGPLGNLPPYTVLNTTGLPAGTYNLSFGVDGEMNGMLDSNAYLDTVEITIPEYTCPDTTNTLDALSESQKAFIASRGNPDMFILGFISEELDESNRATYFENNDVRRIEYWIYNRDQLTIATFDSGHFIKETTVGDSIDDLQATQFSPSQLSTCMGQADIVKLLGEPSCIQKETLAGRSYDYLRYNPSVTQPASTVVLENGALITVLSGYSLDLDSSPADGNMCTD